MPGDGEIILCAPAVWGSRPEHPEEGKGRPGRSLPFRLSKYLSEFELQRVVSTVSTNRSTENCGFLTNFSFCKSCGLHRITERATIRVMIRDFVTEFRYSFSRPAWESRCERKMKGVRCI